MDQGSCWQAGMPSRRLTLAGLCVTAVALVIPVAGAPATPTVSVERVGGLRRLTAQLTSAPEAGNNVQDAEKLLEEEKVRTKVAETAAKFAIQNATAEAAKSQIAVKNMQKYEAYLALANTKLKEALDKAAKQERSLEEAQTAAREAQSAATKAQNAAANAQKVSAEDKRHIASLQASLKEKDGPAVLWFESLSVRAHITLPVVMGIFGVCSICGPSIFMKAFFSLVGAGVGGLLVASCMSFFVIDHANHGNGWLDCMEALLIGNAPRNCYLVWMVFVLLGLMRAKKGSQIVFPGRHDADDLPDDFIDTRPLLSPLFGTNNGSGSPKWTPDAKYTPGSQDWLRIPPPPTKPKMLKGGSPKTTPSDQRAALSPPPAPPKYTPPHT